MIQTNETYNVTYIEKYPTLISKILDKFVINVNVINI